MTATQLRPSPFQPGVGPLPASAFRGRLARGTCVGICGRGPSGHPDSAGRLPEQDIEWMSLNPDNVDDTWQRLAAQP